MLPNKGLGANILVAISYTHFCRTEKDVVWDTPPPPTSVAYEAVGQIKNMLIIRVSGMSGMSGYSNH